MRFWIRLRSAKSEIFVQSSLGFVLPLNSEDDDDLVFVWVAAALALYAGAYCEERGREVTMGVKVL